ncbi:MAG TPA: ferrous iron transporter B [Sedimentibacter sp.]|jgi:ferrous iron transport protein B|nr:ferrous iron transporter B [Sedimentibacter sp.]NLA12999.1 ferrous iron transporter B [Tissierellia bacterium]HOA19288.1 ferrous iron transporter B [Sedimentibacter sp.]HOG62343.1 ferrous iron transporter B [Sedimentibacter sp.]HOT21653.1 ferrous iron transporter B [Sedimentibacter sp.]
MGLTAQSVKLESLRDIYEIEKNDKQYVVALAGNPNTGKSTVFNYLTGLNQHTGNWPGKTVVSARGQFKYKNNEYILIDLPGSYSLFTASKDEEVTRDFLCYGNYDTVVVVADATCLERNLNLVFQVSELTNKIILCINLIDEAKKKNIKIDKEGLEKELKIPIVLTSARNGQGMKELKDLIEKTSQIIEEETEKSLYFNQDESIREKISEDNYNYANKLKQKYVKEDVNKLNRDKKIDDIVTSKKFGIPIMLALLGLIFWITIQGANIPSQILADLLFGLQYKLDKILLILGVNDFIRGVFIDGMYKSLAWVISVMLPPMAIFFPLFTLFEDLGYLPRVAFNLDHLFKRAGAHGKMCLSMCMGFGCNAAGVIGCRIIDSPRERLIAVITNNLVPCNGRFPLIIVLSAAFFAFTGSFVDSIIPALSITLIVLIGVFATLSVSYLLSNTLLKGIPSTFTLELPPYRAPQVGRIIYTSLIDRTIFVLSRAAVVAAPAGAIIWLLANIYVGELSILIHMANFFEPLGRAIGLDGFILIAFIAGFPANEIVIPVLLMAYMSTGTLTDFESIDSLRQILISNGWTQLTAINVMLFSLLHWPCSTTLLTIKKETGSLKWTLAAFIIPTGIAFLVCFITANLYRIIW